MPVDWPGSTSLYSCIFLFIFFSLARSFKALPVKTLAGTESLRNIMSDLPVHKVATRAWRRRSNSGVFFFFFSNISEPFEMSRHGCASSSLLVTAIKTTRSALTPCDDRCDTSPKRSPRINTPGGGVRWWEGVVESKAEWIADVHVRRDV